MTEKEFSKLLSLKTKLNEMKDFICGPEIPKCESVQIIRLVAFHKYGCEEFSGNKEIVITPDLSDEIMNLLKQRLENLQNEFDNFKTE